MCKRGGWKEKKERRKIYTKLERKLGGALQRPLSAKQKQLPEGPVPPRAWIQQMLCYFQGAELTSRQHHRGPRKSLPLKAAPIDLSSCKIIELRP